jgi:hypothetical protein
MKQLKVTDVENVSGGDIDILFTTPVEPWFMDAPLEIELVAGGTPRMERLTVLRTTP